MLTIRDILTPERTLFSVTVRSKKKALELASETIETSVPSLKARDIFDGFIARERLGSTAIGHGVAIPHTRSTQARSVVGCFMLLKEGIHFDAEDQIRVDLLFALVIPEQATEQHLILLRLLAQVFREPENRKKFRHAQNREDLYDRLFSA